MDIQSERVVYGCIKDVALGYIGKGRRSNREAMLELPLAESSTLVNRDMFAPPAGVTFICI